VANLNLPEGLIVLTGAWNTGKTTAAATFLPPSKVGRCFYYDFENSANRIVAQLKEHNLEFGFYRNFDAMWRKDGLLGKVDLLNAIDSGKLPWVDSRQRNSLVNIYQQILRDLDTSLESGKFDVVVFDPIGRLEACMQAYVDANRQSTGWSKAGYGGMWKEGYYPLYTGLFNAIHGRGVKTIILTAHLGNPWIDKAPVPGKVKPKAKPKLYELCQFYVWLVQEPSNADGAPAGVVLKERLGTTGVNTEIDTWSNARQIPRRIPHFTWADVQRYLEQGCNLANPAPGEVPTDEEQEMIDDALSEKQMQLMILRAQTSLAEARSASPGEFIASDKILDIQDPKSLAIKLYADGDGVSVQQIAEQLNKPPALVKVWVGA